MAISSFLVLSLAVLAQARPKHAFEPEEVGNKITLPVISPSHLSGRGVQVGGELSQRSASDEEDKPFHILPFPYPSKRDVEEGEEEDKPFHILPFPYPSKRDVEGGEEEDKPFHILPFPNPSKRDVEEGAEEDKPFHILPFPYPNKRDVEGGEEEDKPFHILPFPYPNKRDFPKDDGSAAGAVTLPVPRPSRRNAEEEEEEDKPFHILPVNGKRRLPVEDTPSKTITLPIIHAHRATLDKRVVEVQVENRSDVSYYAQLNIGTPPQIVYAQIDTGSFELWVNPDCSNVGLADQHFCNNIGVYDPRRSSTSATTQETAELRYGIGEANVSYFLDSISLPGSATMKKVQFGVADSSSDEFSGILGIGAGEGINTNYKNFVDELAAQGVTNTKAFSLALGSKEEEEGVIIFGGVDTAKFTGNLANLPIVPAEDSPDGVARYWVAMNSIAMSPPNGKTAAFPQTSMTVFLDSGSTLTLLPPSVVRQIANGLGTSGMDSSGFYIVDCDLAEEDGTIDFEFDGVTIEVPYSELIRQVSSNPPQCYLGMMGSTQFALLGDTFLRSAYAVFDLTGNMVHLAPYSNCGTRLQTITSTSSLQNLAGACNAQGKLIPSPSPSSSTRKPASKTAASPKTAATDAPSETTAQPQSNTKSSPTVAPPAPAETTTSTKSNPTGVSDAATDKNSAGRMDVQAMSLSVVLAAMGLLLI
ncbi:eukaryotic aspartyl protease [Trichoderma arundinaceum]|uniref:Eukaryotic aspartyl protease n=1 Tax=Trichoderma arundinaceum TaxID=490622 RepID=A0A395NGT2_TRIAR|nr:eukaryotic aspartyl protease [Trichoderma arundinaceum]